MTSQYIMKWGAYEKSQKRCSVISPWVDSTKTTKHAIHVCNHNNNNEKIQMNYDD